MKINGLNVGTLVIALGTASLFAQDIKTTAPPPLPPIPKALDPQTLAARRAVILNRVALSRAAGAAERTNEVAQGAPAVSKGSESGGQTNASTRPGSLADSAPTVSPKAVIGLAPTVESSPAVGVTPSPATAPGGK